MEFGNGESSIGIIFLAYDGKIHELSFNLYKTNDKVTLTKNVSNQPNIISVVKNTQFSRHGAILIDENGNKYDYAKVTE